MYLQICIHMRTTLGRIETYIFTYWKRIYLEALNFPKNFREVMQNIKIFFTAKEKTYQKKYTKSKKKYLKKKDS